MSLGVLDKNYILIVHDILSADECINLIARSEALGYETAAVGGEQIPQLRNNGRALLEDPALAADLWRRASPFIPTRRGGAIACGLHERFRFYRYEASEQFGPHYDGSVRRGDFEESQLTFMVYLSDVDEGGATKFYESGNPLILQFEVRPSRGKALVFDHFRLHEAAPVVQGCKYVLRTDVMYR